MNSSITDFGVLLSSKRSAALPKASRVRLPTSLLPQRLKRVACGTPVLRSQSARPRLRPEPPHFDDLPRYLSRIYAVGIVARASEARFCKEGGVFRTGVYWLILDGPK
jgi:hypothetical protein